MQHCPEADSSKGQKAASPNVAKTFWRPCDLVHVLYAYRCRRRGVHGDGQTWNSIMPIIFDVLYREFCRARLAEMRKQLLLWPGTPVVPERNCEAGHPDDAADRGIGLGSSQEWDRHAERSHS
jgi:hypothetical protein